MAEVKNNVSEVRLFFGLLVADEALFEPVEKRLSTDFGTVDLRSAIFPFTHTTYYNDEMGEKILRRYVSCETLMHMDELPGVKLHTNRLEKLLCGPGTDKRRVNIDPGYLALSKVVLATTKDYDHRLYLGQGIFGEVTLTYKRNKGGYQPMPWTYPDYQEPQALDFFNSLRDRYKTQIRRT
jgi:hypothetical protein